MSKRPKLIINNETGPLSENEPEETHLVEYIECPDIYIINDQELVTTGQFVLNENNSQFVQNSEQKSEVEIEEVDIQNDESNQSGSALQESMEYTMISGSRDKTCYLYCDGQLYLKNRVNYYRCRLHPYCMASGRRNGKMFQLIHPHSDHGDQEDMRKSLMLLNSLKIKSKDDPEHFHDIFDKECSKPEFSDVIDDVNNKLLSTKILKRNRHAFNVISELLKSDSKQSEDTTDGQILNNFNHTPYVLIEGLAIRTRVLYSAGHIYLHTGVNSYRCYLYPKCLGSGHTIGRLFQLMDAHSNHGLKDDEKDRLLLIVAIKRKVQLNPGSLEQIYMEECSRPEYRHIRNKVSLEMIQKLLADQGTIRSDTENQTEMSTEDKDTDLKIPKPYSIINGGSNGHILYCDEQLYNYNRVGYYRCRLYQQGCPATGRCGDETFSLLRGHVGHGSQNDEKNRLVLVETLKKRAATEQLPLQAIYDEEMEKPEFHSVSHLVPYRVMYKTMRKSRHTALLRREEQTEQYPETPLTEVKVYDVNELQHEYNAETVLENAITFCEVNEDGEIEEIEDIKQTVEERYESSNFENNTKSRNNIYPAMEYTLMEGERLGSCILYCNEQLYTLNRSNYYRCRLYAAGCQATGMRDGNQFRLCRDHAFHGSQEPERRRITLINTIKKRTMTNPDPDYFETVFNQECEKPEYADIVEKVSFTVVLNNMRKIWKRYQQQDPTLARNIMKNENLNDLKHKFKPKTNKANDPDEQEVSRMAVEIGDDIPCDQDMSPQEYSLMEGERLGSCLLYCKQQLYTNNQRNYYRCRMYAAGCRATGIMRADRFHLIRAHNGHGTQEREVKRLLLVTAIKRRAQIDPTRLQTIYDEECARPEFRDVADMVCFKKIYSTLDRCRRRAAVDLLEVVEPKIPPGISADNEMMSDQQTIRIYHKTEPEDLLEMEWQEEDPDSRDEEQYAEEYNETNNEENIITNTKDNSQNKTSLEQIQQKLISELGLSDSNVEETYDESDVNISQQSSHSREYLEETNYMFLSGDRFGSKLLYSDGHIYCLNRNNYYRCRIYPHCIATGRVYGNKFRLHRGHSAHALQHDERDRLLLMNSIKMRVRRESERPIKEIFEEESSKSEFREVAQMINYKTALSTLIKCRNRASMAIDEAEEKKYENYHFTETENYDSDTETQETAITDIFDEPGIVWSRGESPISDIENSEIPKPDLNTPINYTLIQGDRTGSCILYSNGHLYTRNRGNYYRCRSHPVCPGSGARRGSFFYMTRQHTEHPLQDDERIRLAFMCALKTRCLSETTSFKQIFDEEITKPEYSAISDLVSFKMIQSTMVKIRERSKYGAETGTIMSSTGYLKQFDNLEYIESDESQDNEYEALKTFKKIDENDIEDTSSYYYILDVNDSDSDVEFVQEYNLDDSVECNVLFSNEKGDVKEEQSTKSLKIYMVDVEKQKNLTKSYEKAKVHLPEIDETALKDNFLNQKENNFNKPILFKMVEDAMNNTFLVYADKQLYRLSNEKHGTCVCRVRCCPAEGVVKGNVFILKTPHDFHALQDKARLQMKLISRIKSRSLAKRSARVAKIFREECLRSEFRSIMSTITLDGISDLIKRNRKKLYPKAPQILEELITNNKSSNLPPPAEFSVITCSTPGIRLLHSEHSLYYHVSKGFYKCAIEGCLSQGRRDRTFFQILQPHSVHEVVDINNKEQLLSLINQLETRIIKDKNVLDEIHSDSEDKILNNQSEEVICIEQQIKYEERMDVDEESNNETKTQDYELDSDNTQNRDILQRAWDLLQIPAI